MRQSSVWRAVWVSLLLLVARGRLQLLAGVDLRHSEAEDLLEVLSAVRRGLQPGQHLQQEEERSSDEVQLHIFVCLHAREEAPLEMGERTRQVLLQSGAELLFIQQRESYCAERYFLDREDEGWVVDMTDVVQQKNPEWGQRVTETLMSVMVIMLGSEVGLTEKHLFDWYYNPSVVDRPVTTSTNDVQCAFHYPMDGVTVYPAVLDESGKNAKLLPLERVPDFGGMMPYVVHIFIYVNMGNEFVSMLDNNDDEIITIRISSMRLNTEESIILPNSTYFGYTHTFSAQTLSEEDLYFQSDLKMTVSKSGENVPYKEICSQEIQFMIAKNPYEAINVDMLGKIPPPSPSALTHPKNGTLSNLSRSEFPTLLQYLGMGRDDVSVEIGTYIAEYSRVFLDRWPQGGSHVCIDPWEQREEYLDVINDSQRIQNSRYREALSNLGQDGSRVVIFRTTGVEAAEVFGVGSVSFVFVDGDHSYLGAMQDMRAWWPKIRFGGVLAGHDFDFRGVRLAVEEFSTRMERKVYFTNDMDYFNDTHSKFSTTSWYMIK